jgi:transposase-like protein
MSNTKHSESGRAGKGRWSAKRKMGVVLELLRGADLESTSRKYGVTAATLSEWREAGKELARQEGRGNEPQKGESRKSEQMFERMFRFGGYHETWAPNLSESMPQTLAAPLLHRHPGRFRLFPKHDHRSATQTTFPDGPANCSHATAVKGPDCNI